MNRVMRFSDSLKNFVSNLGTSKDKHTHTTFEFTPLMVTELENLWRSSWMGRKAVEVIPNDMLREWRTWEADDKQREKIEKLERKLKLKKKLKKALQYERVYGGSAIYLGTDTANPELPLDINTLKEDGLKYIHVFSAFDLTSQDNILNEDIRSERFGLPEIYHLSRSNTTNAYVPIHYSRLIVFGGAEVPDIYRQANSGWGDSIFQVLDNAIKSAETAHSGISSLIHEAKVDVIKVPDLATHLATSEGASRLSTRFSYANTIKSLNNALLLDGNEEFTSRSFNFAGLNGTLVELLKVVSAALDIPIIRFLNDSPSGLNATGNSDMRNYYDNIKAEQNNDLRDNLEVLDEAILRSVGVFNETKPITYEWNDLWQETSEEKAKNGKARAETYQIYNDSGLVDPMVLAQALKNALSQDDQFPGITQAYDEHDPNLENVNFEQELEREYAELQAKTAGEKEVEGQNANPSTDT